MNIVGIVGELSSKVSANTGSRITQSSIVVQKEILNRRRGKLKAQCMVSTAVGANFANMCGFQNSHVVNSETFPPPESPLTSA